MMRRLRLLLVLLLSLGPSLRAEGPIRIDPPFNLSWGEPVDRIERLLAGSGARIVSRQKKGGGEETLVVEGIPKVEGLRRTLFHLRDGQLIGLEMQYQGVVGNEGRDFWDKEKYDAFMSRWRQALDKQYGPGKQLTRETRSVGEVNQTVTSYRWTIGSTNVDVIYFGAEKGSDIFRTLSVHYRLAL
jgi:hypothetical protein